MDLQNLINKSEYDFLREDKFKDIILLTLGGSLAYGTNLPGKSDIDIRGIMLNSKREILTMNCRDKPYENKELDVVIYPLKQITKLIAACNPNVVELFGTKQEHIISITPEGQMLKDNIDIFLSKAANNSFGGYAMQQLTRLENALGRAGDDNKKELQLLRSIKRGMLHFNEKYTSFDESSINLYVDKSNKADFDTEIYADINLDHYPIRDFLGIYSEMNNIMRDYNKINHRNNKKTEQGMLKHAMHLIRLLTTGAEILSGKGIITYREKDKDFLLDIRNGKYTYDEIFEIVDKYEKDFEYAFINSPLPSHPDKDKIDDLVIELNSSVLNRI